MQNNGSLQNEEYYMDGLVNIDTYYHQRYLPRNRGYRSHRSSLVLAEVIFIAGSQDFYPKRIEC